MAALLLMTDGAIRDQAPMLESVFGSFHEKIAKAVFSPEWSFQDLELVHHFTLYTSKSLARRLDMQATWQSVFPKIAYTYEFLMHGILALSAQHLAYLKPEQYSRYLTYSRFHISLGLRTFRKVILNPTLDNCCALFAFSSIIMVYIYASPTESTELETSDALESVIELFKLCRGTLVLKPFIHIINSSPLRPLFRQEFGMPKSSETAVQVTKSHSASRKPSDGLFEGIDEQLDYLSQLIESDIPKPEQRTICFQALECLKASFRTIQHTELPLECGMVYMWPLAVDDAFIDLLKQKHEIALVLLTFYCAQLHVFSCYWFIGSRSHQLFLKIADVLADRYTSWLEWPEGIISQRSDILGPGDYL
ncbi:hypothetical protein BBP40_006699 [Aspergillus hancockii]|nr:hypothetical protein BBP40_006699 [Aspergillus hancockii]